MTDKAVFIQTPAEEDNIAVVVPIEGDELASFDADRSALTAILAQESALRDAQKARRTQFVNGVKALQSDDVALNPPTGVPSNAQILTKVSYVARGGLCQRWASIPTGWSGQRFGYSSNGLKEKSTKRAWPRRPSTMRRRGSSIPAKRFKNSVLYYPRRTRNLVT
jgi:hypothetical protein